MSLRDLQLQLATAIVAPMSTGSTSRLKSDSRVRVTAPATPTSVCALEILDLQCPRSVLYCKAWRCVDSREAIDLNASEQGMELVQCFRISRCLAEVLPQLAHWSCDFRSWMCWRNLGRSKLLEFYPCGIVRFGLQSTPVAHIEDSSNTLTCERCTSRLALAKPMLASHSSAALSAIRDSCSLRFSNFSKACSRTRLAASCFRDSSAKAFLGDRTCAQEEKNSVNSHSLHWSTRSCHCRKATPSPTVLSLTRAPDSPLNNEQPRAPSGSSRHGMGDDTTKNACLLHKHH